MTRYARALHRDLDRYLAFWAVVHEGIETPRERLLDPVPTAWHIRETFEPHTHEIGEER